MTTTTSEPVPRPTPASSSLDEVSGDDQAMRAWAEALVARAREKGVELTGDNGLLTALVPPPGAAARARRATAEITTGSSSPVRASGGRS